MREIKFRGIGVESGEWHFGNLKVHKWKELPGGIACWISTITEDIVLDEVKPETVGQCTGLKDKNGVEIYEGDIVKETSEEWVDPTEGDTGVVKFCRGCFYIDNNCYSEEIWCDSSAFEIIGNIHQNPELLEEKANE